MTKLSNKQSALWCVAIALMTLVSVSCSGRTSEEDENKNPLELTASTRLIEANGIDEVQLTVTFNGIELSAEDVTIREEVSQSVIEQTDLRFATTTEGTYTLYAVYVEELPEDADEMTLPKRYTSNTVEIEAVSRIAPDLSTNNQTSGVTLEALRTDRNIMMIVRNNGEVVTEGLSFSDTQSGQSINVAPVEFVDFTGVTYSLPQWTPSADGQWDIVATVGGEQSNSIRVVCQGNAVVATPYDEQSQSSDFLRRVFIQEYTSVKCNSCPYVVYSLAEAFKNKYYKRHAVVAAIHTKVLGEDPMSLSGEHEDIETQYGYIYDYPALYYDMREAGDSSYCKPEYITTSMDTALGYGDAQAAVSVDVAVEGGEVIAVVSVKAAVDNEFRVGAWLLEDGIYAEQKNICIYEGDYDHHNHVVRVPDSRHAGSDYTGHDLGSLEAGEEAHYTFRIPMDESWQVGNCYIAAFVSSKQKDAEGVDAFYITNATTSRSLSDTVGYTYEEE